MQFNVVMADPPWRFGDKLPGKTRGAERNYETMTVEQVCRYPFETQFRGARLIDVFAEVGVLFLWRVAAIPGWVDVVRAWGFEPKAEVVWVKIGKERDVHPASLTNGDIVAGQRVRDDQSVLCYKTHRLAFGMGRKVRNCHEVCVIAQRGKGMEVADKAIRSVFFAPLREHSRKPDEAYRIAERLYPHADRLELFSRQQRDGWTCVGDEVDKFDAAKEEA